MLEIIVVLAVLLLVIAVPQLRRPALSMLGLLAIIAAGSAVFATVIWALYESKPWLIPDDRSAAQEITPAEPPPSEEDSRGSIATVEEDLAAALAGEEAEQLEEEQQQLEEKRLHIALLAARARVVLEEDRKLAAQATAYPLPVGVGETLGDIMAIRIPAWRDKKMELAQKESIRAWLQFIGLNASETASIVTAKAWGSLYDMWVAENPTVAHPSPQAGASEVASTAPEPAPTSDPVSSAETQTSEEPRSRADQTSFSHQVARPTPPRRYSVPRPPPRKRRPPQRPEREVGPFGY
jgi:hypothetical protein